MENEKTVMLEKLENRKLDFVCIIRLCVHQSISPSVLSGKLILWFIGSVFKKHEMTQSREIVLCYEKYHKIYYEDLLYTTKRVITVTLQTTYLLAFDKHDEMNESEDERTMFVDVPSLLY